MKLDLSPILSGKQAELVFSGECESDFRHVFPDVTFPERFVVDGRITNKAGYMQLTLKADLSYTALCARCLRSVDGVFPFSMTKGVATERMLADMQEEVAETYLAICGNELDLTDEIREEIELTFPVRHLCKPDGLGLCPKCGKDLNEGECGCSKREVDPRMAALLKLLDD